MTQASGISPMENRPASSEKVSETTIEWATAEDAYHLVHGLLCQVTAANDLIVLLATLLGEQPLKRIVETPQWAQYQASRRHIEALQADLDRFVATMQHMAAAQPDCIANPSEGETGAPPPGTL
ncbi:MAG: hypothetical protein ACUVR8_00650 [Acidobacteriota bacterium]